jgi:hypothetical protein
MTSLIMIIAITVFMASVTWFAARRRAGRLGQESADDAAIRDLYDHYRSGIDMLAQAHLERAPTDEEWLAKARARAAGRPGRERRRTPEGELLRWQELLIAAGRDELREELLRWRELAETEFRELQLRGERQRWFRRTVNDRPVLRGPAAIPAWFSRLRVVGASVAAAGIAAGVVFALHGVGRVAFALAMPSAAVLLAGWAAVAVFRVRR